MSKAKPSTPADQLTEIMARIDTVDKMTELLHTLAGFIHKQTARYPEVGALATALNEIELREWRYACSFGLVVDERKRKRIAAAYFNRFLSQGRDVSHLHSGDGVPASSYLSSTDEEFRKMLATAFLGEGEK